MANKDKSTGPVYLLDAKPCTVEEAHRHINEFYGEGKTVARDPKEVIEGLASGKFSCASTAAGVIYQLRD